MATDLSQILQLSVAERIQLVEDIWDSIATSPVELSLTNEQRQELDRRMQAHAVNPDDGISWEELRREFARLPKPR